MRSGFRARGLIAFLVSVTVLAGGCSRPPAPLPTVDPPAPPAVQAPPVPPPTAAPPASPPATAQPPPGPDPTFSYPPYRYYVEGPDVHMIGSGFVWIGSLSSRSEYWVAGGDPVTIEIRFDGVVPHPTDAIRQIQECLGNGVSVHQVGYEADRVFVKVSLPPGRHVVLPLNAGRVEDRPTLVLDKGRPYRLMRWEPGGPPAVLGEYLLPGRPFAAAPESYREEALFAIVAFDDACAALEASLWRWQPGAQPPVRPLPGLWTVQSLYWPWVLPRDSDLIVESFGSVFVLGSDGQLAGRVVDGNSLGAAVGPGGKVAVFTWGSFVQGGFELDLTLINAALQTYRTWDAICLHGRFNDATPDVQPIWHGDEILFLALEHSGQERPNYRLTIVDLNTGSVRRLLGPFVDARRVGWTHFALLEHWDGAWALWDAATASLRTLPTARELGSQRQVRPVALNDEWVVFESDSGLLAWHRSLGSTRLGPGTGVIRAGEVFLWWTDQR